MSSLIGRVLRVTREIPWPDWHAIELDPAIKPGAIVHEYRGCTYGCVAGDEIAVSLKLGIPPFYGVPRDAVEDVDLLDDSFMASIGERVVKSALRMVREANGELHAADETGA